MPTAVGDFFRSDIGKNTAGNAINTVLGLGSGLVLGNQQRQDLKAQSNLVRLQNEGALATEQERTKRALLELEAQKAKPAGNTMLYVGLGVGAVVILGVVIFAVTRSKS